MTEVVICFLIADFITGLVHWLEDTYGLPTWPLIGKTTIEANIEHHRKPNVIGSMGTFIYRNYEGIALAAVATVIAWACGWLTCSLLLVAGFAAMGNEVHAWNHRPRGSGLIGLLQDMAIVQTHWQHARHHKPPYDRNFCTLGNWVNPVLEAVRFWRGLEWVIGCCGVPAKRMSPERSGY